MSASRDKDQRFAFVYSNFYQLYRKSKEASSSLTSGLSSAQVLKTDDLKNQKFGNVQVKSFTPVSLLGKSVAALQTVHNAKLASAVPCAVPSVASQVNNSSVSAVDSLKQNLESLNKLHERLQFMLQELEDLIKDS